MHFLMKLFCTSNSDTVNECRVYFGFKLPSKIILTRTDKFMSKLSMYRVVETYKCMCLIFCFWLVKFFSFTYLSTSLWWIKIMIMINTGKQEMFAFQLLSPLSRVVVFAERTYSHIPPRTGSLSAYTWIWCKSFLYKYRPMHYIHSSIVSIECRYSSCWHLYCVLVIIYTLTIVSGWR